MTTPAGFNEAGPQGAGKRARALSRWAGGRCGFNEAGPQGAGKQEIRLSSSIPDPHASMRPARKGPENRGRGSDPRVLVGASMRPARKGPENDRQRAHVAGDVRMLQ